MDDKDTAVTEPEAEEQQPAPEAENAEVKPEEKAEAEGEAESEDEEKSEEEEEPKPKRRNRPGKSQREIARLRAQNDRLEEMVKALLPRQGGDSPADAVEPREPAREPKQEDFQDYGQYLEARAVWAAESAVDKRLTSERERYQESSRKQALEAAQTRYNERLDEAREKYEDFDDVAFAEDVHIEDTMANAIMDSEIGPDIQYYLGSYPQEAARIARLSPVGQAREIGRLEAKLSAPPPPKRTTSAPPPVTPVTGKGAAPTKVDPDKLSTKEWIEKRQAGKLKV